jgi:hypothetical protein
LAKRPACPSQVFCLCRKVANPGDEAIEKQYFAIDDTRVPVTATPFQSIAPFGKHLVELRPHSGQILQVRHHQGARRLISHGLHRIESVSSLCGKWRRDVRGLVNSSPVEKSALPSAVGDPSDREAIKIGGRGRVGNDEEVKALACET